MKIAISYSFAITSSCAGINRGPGADHTLSGTVGYAAEPKQHEPKKEGSHDGIETDFYIADFTGNTFHVLDDFVQPPNAV